MKKFLHFVGEHGFITASGIAAIIHSVWTLDIMFSGAEVSLQADPINAIFRKFVALMIALAIDIGQIYTSVEIKQGKKSASKYVTFFSFAAATYFLQWVYMVHHTPDLSLAGGVRPEWASIVKLMSDASIWIIPALLPMSTLLYTFSQQTTKAEHELKDFYEDKMRAMARMAEAERDEMIRKLNEIQQAHQDSIVRLAEMERAKLPAPNAQYQIRSGPASVSVECPECDWNRTYPDQTMATNGLRSHKPYCSKNKVKKPVEVSREE